MQALHRKDQHLEALDFQLPLLHQHQPVLIVHLHVELLALQGILHVTLHRFFWGCRNALTWADNPLKMHPVPT
jgi:hypothetical protein